MWQFIKGIDGWVIAGWWHNIVSFCIHPTKTSAVIYGIIIFAQFLLVKDGCRVLAMRESIVNWNEDKAPFPLEDSPEEFKMLLNSDQKRINSLGYNRSNFFVDRAIGDGLILENLEVTTQPAVQILNLMLKAAMNKTADRSRFKEAYQIFIQKTNDMWAYLDQERSRAYWMGMLEMWKITNFPIFYLDLYVLLFGVLGFALPDSFRINADNDTFMSLIFLLTVHYAIQVHQRLKRLGPYTCISILGFDFRMELLYWNRVTFNIVITYQLVDRLVKIWALPNINARYLNLSIAGGGEEEEGPFSLEFEKLDPEGTSRWMNLVFWLVCLAWLIFINFGLDGIEEWTDDTSVLQCLGLQTRSNNSRTRRPPNASAARISNAIGSASNSRTGTSNSGSGASILSTRLLNNDRPSNASTRISNASASNSIPETSNSGTGTLNSATGASSSSTRSLNNDARPSNASASIGHASSSRPRTSNSSTGASSSTTRSLNTSESTSGSSETITQQARTDTNSEEADQPVAPEGQETVVEASIITPQPHSTSKRPGRRARARNRKMNQKSNKEPKDDAIKEAIDRENVDGNPESSVDCSNNKEIEKAKKEQAFKKQLRELLLSQFDVECPCCMDIPTGMIMQCSKGHLICSDCQKRLRKCPTCRQPYKGTVSRNMYAEQIIKVAEFPVDEQ